tara:strand:+ start:233 stop:502 length:270 start_codon:yes stop_codon:yes gene_type:complete
MLRVISVRFLTSVSKTDSLKVLKGLSVSTDDNIKLTDENKYVDDSEEYENMFVSTSFNNIEWGGPLRGGRMLEPTRYGDWERKGRCTDY